jgi:hypothetical protein
MKNFKMEQEITILTIASGSGSCWCYCCCGGCDYWPLSRFWFRTGYSKKFIKNANME